MNGPGKLGIPWLWRISKCGGNKPSK